MCIKLSNLRERVNKKIFVECKRKHIENKYEVGFKLKYINCCITKAECSNMHKSGAMQTILELFEKRKTNEREDNSQQ